MPDQGKVDSGFFEEYVYPHLGAAREEVSLGPRYGVDFGVIEVGGRSLAVATDPVSVIPELGFERAAAFAFDVVCADVAVSGLAPAYLAVNFALPPEMTDAEFATVWETFDREARELGTAIVAGHTARYEGCDYPWVGGATVMGVGDSDELIRPDGARPGDRLILTTGPGVEAVGLLATLYGERMDLPETTIEAARERFEEARGVRDALCAAAAGGVTAMHDATEGGLQGALCEMADAAGVRIDVEREAVGIPPGVEAVCAEHELDPWRVTSSGSLLIAVDPAHMEIVLAALEERGTTAAAVGHVGDGNGAYADGERLEAPAVDRSWEVYAEYAGESLCGGL